MTEISSKPNVVPRGAKVAKAALSMSEVGSETPPQSEVSLPCEGGTYEEDDHQYRFTTVTYHTSVRDPKSVGGLRDVEHPHSLRTWFSHETDEAGPGPGWDSRLHLPYLTPEQMLRRYGHIFTNEEISNPMGKEDWETGERIGGMPDNIPYFAIEPAEK